MAKNAVSDWDSTAANNTDVGGIAIQGSSLVSNFDNALREMMAQLKTNDTAIDDALNLRVKSAGFRNKLINPLGTINQRSYTSGAATTAANQYTVDRWHVVTSGQSLAWTESAGVRTFTAPAGGVEQVIEGANILTGVHTLSWTGTATATVNGVAVANGGQDFLAGGVNAKVRFSSGTFSKPQFEPGSYATEFEQRHPQQEVALCERYYNKFGNILFKSAAVSGQSAVDNLMLSTTMRTTPTVSFVASLGTGHGITASTKLLTFAAFPDSAGSRAYDSVAADAEIAP